MLNFYREIRIISVVRAFPKEFVYFRGLFMSLCGSLNAFPQKSCFSKVLARARLEYWEDRGFLV